MTQQTYIRVVKRYLLALFGASMFGGGVILDWWWLCVGSVVLVTYMTVILGEMVDADEA